MEIILGFRTPASTEIPAVLYLGDDADAALRIAEATDFPRVARLRNPQLYPIRHWSEAASEAYESARKQSAPPVTETPAGTAPVPAASGGHDRRRK